MDHAFIVVKRKAASEREKGPSQRKIAKDLNQLCQDREPWEGQKLHIDQTFLNRLKTGEAPHTLAYEEDIRYVVIAEWLEKIGVVERGTFFQKIGEPKKSHQPTNERVIPIKQGIKTTTVTIGLVEIHVEDGLTVQLRVENNGKTIFTITR
jgi:hypothetical protein